MLDSKRLEIIKNIQSYIREIEINENVSLPINITPIGISITIQDNNEDRSINNIRLSKRYGFDRNIIGLEFTSSHSNKSFKIVGFKTTNRKYPILANEVKTDKIYKFSSFQILSHIGGKNFVNRSLNLNSILD